MEEILAAIVQFLIELIFEMAMWEVFDVPTRNKTTPEPERLTGVCVAWFLIGCLLGAGSLVVLDRSLITVPALRIANLILAPFASANLSQGVARLWARSNDNLIPRNHFWKAFWFTLGFVAVRFAYIDHATYFNPLWD